MGAFKNTLRLLVVLGVLTALAKPKPRKGNQSDGDGDGDTGGRPNRGKGGQSDSTAEIQGQARTNAENLNPDQRTANDDGTDPNDPDNDDTNDPDNTDDPGALRHDREAVRDIYSQKDANGKFPPDAEFPPGWGVRENNQNPNAPDVLHDENGHPVRDPDKPYTSDREKYFPGGFSQKAHDEMVRRHTAEGRQPDGTTGTFPAGKPKPDSPEQHYEVRNGIPVDPDTGKAIPRDRLSWFAPDGSKIDYYRTNSKGETVTNLTYDHKTPVVKYWHDEGYRSSWEDRQKWYNKPENLVPMGWKENSSKSGDTGDGKDYRYQDKDPVGPPDGNYTPKGKK